MTNSSPFLSSTIVKNLAYINLAVMPFHICNILLIVLKRNLHKNVFILLANLSVSDIFLQLFLCIFKSHFSRPIIIILSIFDTCSLLFTLAINIDRYLKVKYGLRYYEIVLTRRLVAAITITWTFAIFFCVIPMSLMNDDSQKLVMSFKLGFNIFCSIVMLLSSMWVVSTRNSHSRRIKQQQDVVAKARYNQEALPTQVSVTLRSRSDGVQVLKSIKKATQEMIRLSLVTALMIIVGSTLHLLMPYWKKFVLQMVGVLAREMYIMSNPFVYIYVMADLRKHYIAHLRQCFRYLRPTREVSGDVEHRAEVATTVAATTEAATTAPTTTEAATTETATIAPETTVTATIAPATIAPETTAVATVKVSTTAPATVATATFAPAIVEAADTINEATINSHN